MAKSSYINLILLMIFVAAAESIVCPPNYCDSVNCINEVSCEEGKTLAPTFCGCCQHCIPVIKEGERCLSFLGSPPMQRCSEGLICCNGVCSQPSNCLHKSI